MLTDNWPSVDRILKNTELYQFFTKVYISSFYGTEKCDGTFFDYPINDFNIKSGEALFVDDYPLNLDIALSKGLDTLLMEREGIIENNQHRKIKSLFSIK